MDFTSYSSLYQAKMGLLVPLDTGVLLTYSQCTFHTSFQHFASQTKWVDGHMLAYSGTTGDDSEKVKIMTTTSATWLSLAITFVLVIVLIILTVTLKTLYPRDLLRNNNKCVADVLALIKGNEELL